MRRTTIIAAHIAQLPALPVFRGRMMLPVLAALPAIWAPSRAFWRMFVRPAANDNESLLQGA
jgi:hypothetical protein